MQGGLVCEGAPPPVGAHSHWVDGEAMASLAEVCVAARASARRIIARAEKAEHVTDPLVRRLMAGVLAAVDKAQETSEPSAKRARPSGLSLTIPSDAPDVARV